MSYGSHMELIGATSPTNIVRHSQRVDFFLSSFREITLFLYYDTCMSSLKVFLQST